MLPIDTTLNLIHLLNIIISRLFLSAVPFSKLQFQTDQMKSAGCLNGKFYMVYAFSEPVATHLCANTIHLLIAWFMKQHFPNPNNMG